MSIDRVQCPACGAPITATANSETITCAYCATDLQVRRKANDIELEIVETVSNVLKDAGQETQGAITDQTQTTKAELRRLQLAQTLTSLQLQLSQVRAEIRSLEREKSSSKIRRQLRELYDEKSTLQEQVASINAVLNPGIQKGKSNVDEDGRAGQDSRTGQQIGWYTGCLPTIGIFLLLSAIIGALVPDSDAAAMSIFIICLIFYFAYRSRKKKRLKENNRKEPIIKLHS